MNHRLYAIASLLIMMPVVALAQLPTPTYGWNLGNTLEPPSGEGTWGPAATQKLINAVADSGFNTIRLPVAWDSHANPSTHVIDPAWLARVKQVVDWCYARNLTVVVNCHWDGGWLENHIGTTVDSTINAKMQSYWTQIATTFAGYDDHLLFAGANEPNCDTAAQWTTLRSYYNTFISAVRAAGGNNTHRWLVVQGPNTNIDLSDQLVTSLPDDSTPGRLVFEIHHYPYQWTIMTEDASWGKMFYFWGQGYHSPSMLDRNSTWGEEAYTDEQFQKMATKFVAKGVPVIIGEWGAVKRIGYSDLTGAELDRHLASRVYYSKYVTEKANALGLKPFWWDAGGTGKNSMWLFDRNTAAIIDPDNVKALTAGGARPPSGSPPSFVLQPVSRRVYVGRSVTFTASATGTTSPTIQWQKNGIAIPGATANSLAIPHVTWDDRGVYTAVATNGSGSTASLAASLEVLLVPGDFNSDGKSDIVWQNRTNGARLIWLMDGTGVSSGVGLSTVPGEWEITATGDFNADGKTDLVWTNTATGERTIWLMDGTSVSTAAGLGTIPTEWVIAGSGDFNGDGKSDLVWQNTQTGERSLWLMNGTAVSSGVGLGTVSPEWWIAGTGDFNGDGQTDLYWQNTVTGEHLVWYMNGTSVSSGAGLGTYPQYSTSGIGDYNADGKPDLLMTNQATGERSFWLMDGTTVSSTVALTTLSLDWILNRSIPRRTQADFNRDGKTDILWQNTLTGERLVWLMNGTSVASGVSLGLIPVDWTIAATGDFNNDSKSDLVWQNTTTGERSIWLMDGTNVSTGAGLGVTPVDWSIGTSGDFNADGKSDLVLQNMTTEEAVVWLMNGTIKTSTVSLGIQAGLRLAAAGDFNNDGKSDLVWRNPTSGEHKIWLMNGTTKSSEVSLGTFGSEWAITGSGDFNQDGKSDLLWQNSLTGERLLWLMNGTSVSTGLGLGTYPTEWSLRN